MKKLLAAFLIVNILSACTDPQTQVLPSTIDGNEEKIKKLMEGLSDEDKQLLTKRLIVSALSEKMQGKPLIGPGTTIADAIKAQKDMEQENAFKEAKQEAMKQEYLKQQAEAKQKFNSVLDVSLLEKKFYKKDFEDGVAIKIAFKNNGDKKIIGIKGVALFKDIFGDLIKGVNFSNDQEIDPSQTYVFEGSIDYNQFMDEDKKLANTDTDKIKFEFEPKTILFSDGSKITAETGTEK